MTPGRTVDAHYSDCYETRLEQYLAARIRWLWRKAIFLARMVVKLNAKCKGVQTRLSALRSTRGSARDNPLFQPTQIELLDI